MNRPLDLPSISVDLSREADFSIGVLRVYPSHRQVSANGHQETVQPRVMQVLVALVRAKGGVLSRDNLIEACWDGVVVGDDAINAVSQKSARWPSWAVGHTSKLRPFPAWISPRSN